MKVKTIGSNQVEIENGETTVLFSYDRPVAAFVEGRGGIRSEEFFSHATSRHVSAALARWGCSKAKVEVVAQSALVALVG